MITKSIRIVSFILSLITSVTCFCACSDPAAGTTQAPDSSNTFIPPTEVELTKDYIIVYAPGADKSSAKVRTIIRDVAGSTPSAVSSENSTQAANFEVLIGDTGRSESTEFISTLSEHEYGVKIIASENSVKIIIASKESENIGYATELFASQYVAAQKEHPYLMTLESKKGTVEDGGLNIVTIGGIKFESEIITVSNVSGIPYTRMTKLKDGRLMMVYGQSNQIVAIYSSDNGQTWSDQVNVTSDAIDQDDKDGKKLYLANAMAYQLEDGTILVAYRANEAVKRTKAEHGDKSVEVTGKYHSSIRIMGSTDNGKTFVRHSIVWDLYEENIQKWYASFGLWEPHLGMLNGELACIFAIGKSVYGYDHPINSTDIFVYRNNTWVRANYDSDEVPGSVKNGMPVWQEVMEGGYVMAVESNQNNKGTYKNVLTAKLFTSKDGINWTNQCDVYIPKKNKRKSGAPYVVQLPNGQIIVSYMTDDDLANQSKEDVGCIFKFSISKPGISVFDLDGEEDFSGPFNVFGLPVGSTSVYGGMYIDEEYLYMYCATNSGGNKILLRRAPLSQFETAE